MVAYDTPQGLKDSLLKSNESEIKNALSQISAESDDSKEDIDNLALRKMSILLENFDESIIDGLDGVKSIEIEKNNRINLRIDSFDDSAVNNILKHIIDANGVIKSVSTEEPSLEDVFIKATSEVNENDRA